ncbi:MAG TPA: hypothetical protein VFH56_02690 [Acidimicrobiales bacterium]|nr:hypothetical protein [Acidimicrobiales bacterium]
MAGTLSGFDPDSFRSTIQSTMTMGLPGPTNLQPTFYFRETYSYPQGTVLDPEGKPIDPRVQATATPAASPVQVPCAVEFSPDNSNNEGPVGTFWTDRAVLTLLDTDYATVATAVEVDINGQRYLIQQMSAIGLGPVTVYQLQCFMKGTGGSE